MFIGFDEGADGDVFVMVFLKLKYGGAKSFFH